MSNSLFIRRLARVTFAQTTKSFATITNGVSYNHVAREWRLKWSEKNDKASLASVQKIVDENLADIKKIDGVKEVQRVVCGGCHDYKLIVTLPADKFPAWSASNFAPESKLLAAFRAVDGVSTIETQTFTIEKV